jgi:NAD(P)-dependent dehydrogenase (short-subunit alcohol dehydrogenase family)
LDGDVVIFAGATGRVGGATLRRLLRAGARVVVVSRSRAAADAAIDAATHAESASGTAITVEADLRLAPHGEAVTFEALRTFGRIDAVVSLAGGGSRFVSLVDSDPNDLRESVTNNLEVAYHLALPALRAMLAQEPRPNTSSRGRFVFVTAGSSLTPQPRFGLMGMGKAGVNVLMLAIAREHKADGIVANAVVLGGVATDAARGYMSSADFAAAATPDEVANVLAFHASDASSGVNGALVHVNAREID